jgi:sucrose-6-phosphate hydrolase SacC (GH32 family)
MSNKKNMYSNRDLNYHLMHPGDESLPGDPNAAFFLDGVYHLHYILRHPFGDKLSYSFIHVTSPDLLNWTWQPTKLQPSFTGHGMFSGTGFITMEGRPAVIYHGEASGYNQIALAADNLLSAWEPPYPVEVNHPDGRPVTIKFWDPDCFQIDDSYYAISGGGTAWLMKSSDLQTWTLLGEFMTHDLEGVVRGEDISCPNFFQLGEKWMLLCISHSLGCRYYIGDWDAQAEQFVPETHGRMNWRRDNQGLFGLFHTTDFFAPESVLTADGRRVMWAWCTKVDEAPGKSNLQSIQSLPRELSLPSDGVLRIKPLKELESLRFDPTVHDNIAIDEVSYHVLLDGGFPAQKIGDLPWDSMEMRLTIEREQAERKLFGLVLFAEPGEKGLPIVLRPDTGTLRVGTIDAPFSVTNLPQGEDLVLRVFIDKYVVEVFANDRQAVYATHLDCGGQTGLLGFSVDGPMSIKRLEMWRIKPTNQGFRDAQRTRIWEPDTQ